MMPYERFHIHPCAVSYVRAKRMPDCWRLHLIIAGYFTHGSGVKLSRCFDIVAGDVLEALGCLKYILKMAAGKNSGDDDIR